MRTEGVGGHDANHLVGFGVGDGSTARDYTYVTDTVDGILACTRREFGFEIFNLGESQTVRLDYLISLLEKALGLPANIDRQPPQPGDVAVRDGNAVLNGSVELRFPLLGSWFGGVFWDWGGIAEAWSGQGQTGVLGPRSFRHSVGGGLRYVLAGQIPVRLDYGIAIDRRCRDVGLDSDQCTLDDAGNLHWSLLYAF